MGRLVPVLVFFLLVFAPLFSGCISPAAESREWNQKGETDHIMGHDIEALAAFDRAIALDPESGEAWRNRGLSLSQLGRMN
jgi:Flp pilus assembly protein TadD